MGKGEVIDPRKDWSSEYSIGFLPREIRNSFRGCADLLYHNLRSNHLEVILVPAPVSKYQDHMIRVAVSQNPVWYRELNRTRHSPVRRPHSLRALDRIRNVRDPELSLKPKGAITQNYAYVTLYREIIFEMLVFGYEENGLYVPSEPRVQGFFGVEGIDKILDPPF
ncbi:hypothetical protein HY500_00940 [Candidatus Woesearchaeota archaeon]|nr:hypothetical protein [Candidatus Woesearchaeota archaeon]